MISVPTTAVISGPTDCKSSFSQKSVGMRPPVLLTQRMTLCFVTPSEARFPEDVLNYRVEAHVVTFHQRGGGFPRFEERGLQARTRVRTHQNAHTHNVGEGVETGGL